MLFEFFGLDDGILIEDLFGEEFEGIFKVDFGVDVGIILCFCLVVFLIFILDLDLVDDFIEWFIFFDFVGEFGVRGDFGRWYIFIVLFWRFFFVEFEEFELLDEFDVLFYCFGDFEFDCGGGE